MERVKRVNVTQTLSTKELDCLTVGAAVYSLFVAEFTMVVGGSVVRVNDFD